jgi:cell wall-associated NlpC family hydrolase
VTFGPVSPIRRTLPSDATLQPSDGRKLTSLTTIADVRTKTPATAGEQASARRRALGAEGNARVFFAANPTSRVDAPRRGLAPQDGDVQGAFDRREAALTKDVEAGVPGAREELAAVQRDREGVQTAIDDVRSKIAANEDPATWANVTPRSRALAEQADVRAQLAGQLRNLNTFGVKVAGMNAKEREDLANFFRAVSAKGAVPTPAPAASTGIQAAIDFGLTQLGAPYVGGASPFRFGTPGDGRTYQMDGQRAYVSQKGVVGYDCSGLMVTMLKKAGIDISGLASSRAMKKDLPEVPKDQLQPGDLLVKNGHVAMYIGDGKMIESVPSGVRVADASKYIDNDDYTGHRPG